MDIIGGGGYLADAPKPGLKEIANEVQGATGKINSGGLG